MKIYMCAVCGWIYYEASGLPDHGIAPSTLWAHVPDDWRCPECNVGKADFVMCEV
ncbi:rubredoxin [Acidovorax sp. Root70]|uniref:rubredoxin n=1 Tax=Acidovorax sp. Root70 TaxID=1736590 RepID=UPI0006FA0AFA|nr:rubredoxin [Acidovorax sp. Root70]KRB41915.1 rubredoxin [Acidovorax sp. Root70]